jgi:TolB-like protein/class 3 adenylate cyclase
MGSESYEQKLAAILYADVAGYSRLMGDDEHGTHRILSSYLDLFTASIERHGGRVVHFAGDAVLADFSTVAEALTCAVSVQRDIEVRNHSIPEDRKLQFRIGINLGDVLVDPERDEIYGDGVNVAARLESLADAGGICVSETVRSAVGKKLPYQYDFQGEQRVKNIAEPIAVYKVLVTPGSKEKTKRQQPVKGKRSIWQLSAWSALILLIVGAAATIFWLREPTPPLEASAPDALPASKRAAFLLPDGPTIAVLPFENVSGETEQDYFADGITDDLITDLSKITGLFVSGRNAVYAYKGKRVKLSVLADELGVHYVLQGSVRKAGDKVRINTQLMDVTTGKQAWAERYDGSLADVFALQDEVTQKIVVALAVKLKPGDSVARSARAAQDPKAYDAFLQGWSYYRRATPRDFARAIPKFTEAIERNPRYGRAYAALAEVYRASWTWGWHRNLGISKSEALELAKTNLREAMKHPTSLAFQVASTIYSAEGRHETAIIEAERAIKLGADDAELDPQYPSEYVFWLGMALFGENRFDEAAVSLERAGRLAPDDIGTYLALTATYGHLGREQDAKIAITKLEGLARQAGYENGIRDIEIWAFKESDDRQRLRDGLRKAGLTELPQGHEG